MRKINMTQTDTLQLHRDGLVIDGLNASNFFDPRLPKRLHDGGLTAVNATVAAWHTPEEALHLLASALHLLDQQCGLLTQVRSVDDIHRAKESNRVGFILGFQGADPIGDDLHLLALYHMLGVRIIQLTYNFRNRVGCGCLEKEDDGLSDFGRQVVAEMNRLGILVDLSHCGIRTTREAIELSQQPVAFTHANALALCPHPRNKSDDTLKALAATGGVVGVVIFAPMLTCSPNATLDDYVRMIDYLVNLVGVDHVGLGPDFMEEMTMEVAMQALRGLPPEALKQFSHIPPTRGFESIANCANVTDALIRRGYGKEDVTKIIGRNWLRLYRQVWK